MKIYIATTWNAKCGIATYSAFLAEELISLGHDVKILAEKNLDPKSIDKNFPGKKIPFVECWSRSEGFKDMEKVIEKEKPDILSLQHQFALFPTLSDLNGVAFLAKKGGCRIMTTLHDVIPYSAQSEGYFKHLIGMSDSIIVHTSTCKRLLMNDWHCPESKIKLIMHGTKLVDVPSKLEARKTLGLEKNAKILLSYGFVWPSKGLHDILRVLAELKKTIPELIYIHAGGQHPVFPYADYVKQLIKTAMSTGITPKDFKITGFINDKDLIQYFGACDVIVLNYMRGSASASGAAHRSLSSHRPIVGTDDFCIEEIPKLEYAKGDIQGLMQSLKKILGDENLQKELILKAEKVAEESSWANTAKKYVA